MLYIKFLLITPRVYQISNKKRLESILWRFGGIRGLDLYSVFGFMPDRACKAA